jgi:hypothetical protein
MSPAERDAWMQDRYAAWLDALTRIAFVLSMASFAVYVTGALPPWVPAADLPGLWHLPLEEYLARTSAPTGWAWLGYIARGDYLNYLGLSLFACVTVVCHLAILVPLLRRGERLMAALVVAQVLVLAVAASGVAG